MDRRIGGEGDTDLVVSLRLTWIHLDSFGLAWNHLDSSGLIWTHLESLGSTWTLDMVLRFATGLAGDDRLVKDLDWGLSQDVGK